jgi:hypothetical protein
LAKESGLGLSVIIDDSSGSAQTISTDVLTVGISMPTAMQDVTAVSSSAMERLYLLADLQITFGGVFDDGANLAHAVLKDYRTCTGTELGRTTAVAHSGQTLSHAALKYNDYNLTRAADGSFTWTTTGMCASGAVPAWS